MLFDPLAFLGLDGFRIEHADDAIGVAHRGYFGIGDDDGFVGKAHRKRCAALDARRAVAQHPVEPRSQFGDDLADALVGECILVAGLRSRQQPQIFQALVADQRLRQFCDALHHVDQVEHHAPFGAHHQIEVAQADIEVDDRDALSVLRERGAERRR